MKKNDLFLNQGILFRVLDNTDSQAFIFNCLERTTPYWTRMEPTDDLKIVPEERLLQATNTTFPNFSLIPPDKRKLIQEKYGTISLILPYVSNGAERNRAIELCAKTFGLSKATIRNRLYSYLAFQDIRIFLPNIKETPKELSADEKNFRWALNKYYYNAIKLPLIETYRRLLKDRYCDDTGKVLPTAPTFRQFSYFYQKTVNQENLIISRDGKGNFLRNHRAMLGSGIRDFCPTLGYGMFDSTICDSGPELLEQLKVLPPYKNDLTSIPERLMALLDIYKIFIPNQTTIDIYNRLYLSLINSLEKKNTLLETQLANDNFRAIKGLKRYGVIGGMESFRITGTAGLGKTSSIQRCADVITGNKVLISNQPYKEIIPILFVECVADGSFKSLLYSILQEVDTKLGTTYFLANKHQTTTVDTLLASVGNVLINHVALLVIDEIERVANDSKKGQTLINYLTQLVNQSNIAICFVGNESANKYFQMKEYMSRRTIGTSIKRMDYDETFYNFLSILFRYQYTLHKVELTAELARTFYKFTNGAPAIIVSLFVETQKYMILNGQEKLDMKSLELVFKENFNNMFIYLDKNFEEKHPKKKEPTPLQTPVQTVLQLPMEDNLFARVLKESNKNITRALAMLNDYTNVEFI